MTPAEIRDILETTGAIRQGHFQLSSGLHSPSYVQCALVLQHPQHAARLSQALAERLAALKVNINVVASPALGGVVFGYELARQLGVRAIFAERDAGGSLTLRRGFSVEKGERVVVAEDVVTTGGSTRETIEVIRRAGGEVVAVTVLLDRSGGVVRFDVPFEALLAESIPTYSPGQCPLCRQGVPVDKPGSRPVPA